ncbi:hypothetical protein FOL47_009762 [Perkinsus chesapeaki]|uniref:Uncharacterized protein n=1 Tax=Perkinsus chesapeaki TaxID=330153 RepID=A0A7J6MR78_PERCH|nr:hypothetical protein FOL47_009762 [Perkinsus chesapeaki]
MLLKVYLLAHERTPAGQYYVTRRRRRVAHWCVVTNWKDFESEGRVNITVVCYDEGRTMLSGVLRLQEDSSDRYEVTEKGEGEYKSFIDLVMTRCHVSLYRVRKPRDLFTFNYYPVSNLLVTSINHTRATMEAGECP